MITYREYQPPCINDCLRFFRSKRVEKPRLAIAPTASGKSIIIAGVAHELEGNILVLQPSKELLKQNFSKYLMYDTNAAMYSASMNRRDIARVTFSTIGTITKVPELFNSFQYLIIDEAHLYPSAQESMFGSFIEKNPQLKILGLTATPFRLKSEGGGSKLVMMHNSHIFKGYAHIIQIKDIAPKYWSKIKYVVRTDEAAKAKLKVNSTGADYTDKSLEVYGKSIHKLIDKAIETFAHEQGLVFLPSVKEAQLLAKKYPGSACLHSKTPDKERDEIIRAFKAGEIKRIMNFGILSVGFDYPELYYVIDAIPTLSLAKHYQLFGRLTRLHPQGREKYYMDFAGNYARFGRVDQLEIRKVGTTYHVFGEGGKKLTGEVMHSGDGGYVMPMPTRFADMDITFGKHKGKSISQLYVEDLSYLSWIMDNATWNKRLVHMIKLYMEQQKNSVIA